MSRSKKKASPSKKTSAVTAPRRPGVRTKLSVLAIVGALGGLYFWAQGPKAGPWNVVLISVDTLRADHLSSYGENSVSTPHMDRLASEGVLFERATSVAPTTLPAHASLFTGLTPIRHGVHDNIGFYLTEDKPTLAAHLRDHGYQTAGFVGSFVLDARFGVDRGFDVYDDELGANADALAAGLVAQRPGNEVVESFVGWLESRDPSQAPFFAFVHLYDPHTPYAPPSSFLPATLGRADPANPYRGEVAFVDSLVGELLQELAQLRLDEHTVVVLTSDHGESLGEHGELTHGFFLYESTLRIPLIFRYPNAPAGTRVSALARIEDLAPTILELVDVPPMRGIDGETLLPYIKDPASTAERTAYAQTFVPRLEYGFSELKSLRRGDTKFVLAPRPELYDLASDPLEATNLVESQPGIARQMREELEQLMASEVISPRPAPLDADARAKLESLGYLGARGNVEASGPLEDPKDQLDVYLAVNDPSIANLSPDSGTKFEETIARLREALAQFPGMSRAYVLLGDLLLRGGRPSEAERVFADLVALDGRRFEGHYGVGMANAHLGNWARASQAFEASRAIEPQNTKSYFQLAEVSAARGQWTAAEDWLRQAIELSPDPVLVGRLADALLEQGRTRDAETLLRNLRSKHPEDASFILRLARVLGRDGNTEAAVEELTRASERSPDDPELRKTLADTLVAAARLEEAVPEYRRAIEIDGCHAPSHTNLGSTLAQLGRMDEASEALERAVACQPGYALAHKNLAALKMELGDLDGAIRAMENAVRTSPRDPELVRSLAELQAYARSRKR